MITINCPKCNAPLQFDDTAAGTTAKCSACDAQVEIPAVVAAAAPAVSPLANAQAQAAAVAGKALSSITCTASKFAGSKFAKTFPLWIGIASFVIGIAALVLSLILICDDPAFDFSDDAEDTAAAIFEAEITGEAIGYSKKAYYWNKFKCDAISDAQYEVFENDDFAVVLAKTKINGRVITKTIYLKKNADGIWIPCETSDYEAADKEWREDLERKIEEHEAKNEKETINYDNVE